MFLKFFFPFSFLKFASPLLTPTFCLFDFQCLYYGLFSDAWKSSVVCFWLWVRTQKTICSSESVGKACSLQEPSYRRPEWLSSTPMSETLVLSFWVTQITWKVFQLSTWRIKIGWQCFGSGIRNEESRGSQYSFSLQWTHSYLMHLISAQYPWFQPLSSPENTILPSPMNKPSVFCWCGKGALA